MNISICIASYNGEKFITEQIISILDQITIEDEIIIIDDCSSDRTTEIIKSFGDQRIKLFLNDRNRGINFSFARAIALAENDIIFMSDQDDVWIKGRVELMIGRLLDTESLVVSSNSEFMDITGNKIFYPVDGVREKYSTNSWKNIFEIFIGKKNYYGCAMAFRSKIVNLILPIPSFVESHDLWIALASNLVGSNSHLEEKTLMRRVHGTNASIIERGLAKKLWSRLIFILSILVLLYRAYLKKVDH